MERGCAICLSSLKETLLSLGYTGSRVLDVGRTALNRRRPLCSLPRKRPETQRLHLTRRPRFTDISLENCAMKSSPRVVNGSRAVSFRIVALIFVMALLWLNTLAKAQTSNDMNTSPPADRTQFLRDNMQRWNPYETVLVKAALGHDTKLSLAEVNPRFSLLNSPSEEIPSRTWSTAL